jgi:2-oxoisovalerate dehydrogenase E1 component
MPARLTVPRLQGHSFQDTQTYKSEEFVTSEWARDPLPKLRSYLVGPLMDAAEWDAIEREAAQTVERACEIAEARPVADPETVMRNVFFEGELQAIGGQWTHGYAPPPSHEEPRPEGSGSTWSPRSAAPWIASWRSIRALSCSARISGQRAAFTR